MTLLAGSGKLNFTVNIMSVKLPIVKAHHPGFALCKTSPSRVQGGGGVRGGVTGNYGELSGHHIRV